LVGELPKKKGGGAFKKLVKAESDHYDAVQVVDLIQMTQARAKFTVCPPLQTRGLQSPDIASSKLERRTTSMVNKSERGGGGLYA